MKHLKLFETFEEEPQVGDFVLMKSESPNPKIVEYINKTIGKIIIIRGDGGITVMYDLKNDFLRDQIDDVRSFYRWQLVAFGKTKKELRLKISANKYNL